MKSKFTQHVLGIYCSGFISALILLFLVDHSKPLLGPLIMIIIAIINLAAFVYFIHHSSRFLQINNLIDLLKEEGLLAIKQLYKAEHPYIKHSAWNDIELKRIKQRNKTVIKANDSGYIQTIDWNGLVNWAVKNDCVVEIQFEPGSFIHEKLPIITIYSDHEQDEEIHKFIVIGNERSDVQDFEFTVEKLEEIALRAISPSTNDPHTAVNCMNRLGILLTELGAYYDHKPFITNKEHKLSIIHHPMKYEDYLYKTFYELRHYGQDDVSVLYGILNVLYKIAAVSEPKIKREIWTFHYYINEVIEWDNLSKLDHMHLQTAYDNLERCCKA